MWIRETGWPTATPSAVAHGVDEKIVLPYARTGDFEELHSLFCMRGEENFTQRFFILVRAILPNDGQKLKYGDHQVFSALSADWTLVACLFHQNDCDVTCSVRRVPQKVSVKWCKRAVRLCVNRICFKEYHTKVQPAYTKEKPQTDIWVKEMGI